MKIDLYKHRLKGGRLWAVPAGLAPLKVDPYMAQSEDMKALLLYRRGVELGVTQEPVFDHTRVRADIARQGWAKITLHTGT